MSDNGLFSFFGKPNKPKKEVQRPVVQPSRPPEDKINLPSDIKNMLEKMRGLHDELERKLEDAFQKTGWNPSHIKKYLENPNNFNSHEWERVQRERKAMLNSIWKKLGKNVEQVQKDEKIKAGEKAYKDRKGKTLGSRRNWIPMH
jgi:hypothetical protein